jgi:hypothetical protein
MLCCHVYGLLELGVHDAQLEDHTQRTNAHRIWLAMCQALLR